MTITVTRNHDASRYEATLDGQLAGFIDYRLRDGQVTLIHTETLVGFEGRGVGSALAKGALEDIRAQGETALVLCPFIQSWLARHPDEYADVVGGSGQD